MSKKGFKDYICRPFCAFYRASEKEELACGGALIFEKLVKNRTLSADITYQMNYGSNSHAARNVTLDSIVCAKCDFIGDGCDFQSGNDLPDAEPCGGYKLLDILMKMGAVSLEDLENDDGS
jgi:hypothetical protein